MFTYYCGDLDFSGDFIGYVTGDGISVVHEASLSGTAQSIACLNVPNSPWVNVVYGISGSGMHIFSLGCTVAYIVNFFYIAQQSSVVNQIIQQMESLVCLQRHSVLLPLITVTKDTLLLENITEHVSVQESGLVVHHTALVSWW